VAIIDHGFDHPSRLSRLSRLQGAGSGEVFTSPKKVIKATPSGNRPRWPTSKQASESLWDPRETPKHKLAKLQEMK